MRQELLKFFLFVAVFFSVNIQGYSTEQPPQTDNFSQLNSYISRATRLVQLATNHDSVVQLLDKAENLAKSEGNQHISNHILILRGLNEYHQGNYEKAIEYNYNALELSEKNQDSVLIAKAFQNLGLIYNEMEEYDEAISYLNKSLDISEKIKESELINKNYQNLSICYQNKKDLTKALELNERANQLAKIRKDTVRIIDALNNFGTIAYDQKKFDESLECYQKALILYLKINDQQGVAMAYNNIGLAYLDKKDYKKSLEYFKKSLSLANQLKMTSFIKDVYGNLTVYYAELKDYRNAYLNYDKYNTLYDSLIGEKRHKMIRQIQAKYQLHKNSRELEELKLNNQTQLEAIDQARSFQIYLFAITFLVVVLMIITVYLLVKEKKLGRELHQKTLELQELNVSKDKLFSIIGHDLKNPFNVLIGYTSILKTDLEMFSTDELKQIILDLNQASENGFELLQNLLVWSRTQTNKIHLYRTSFKLTEVISQVSDLAELCLNSKNQKLICEIDPSTTIFADKDMIATIFRNLIFNAIKFSPKGSEIVIRSEIAGEFIHIHVVDNGIGIEPAIIGDLFKIGKVKSGFGTEGESGTGLGLAICKEFIEKNNGRIWVESQVGSGSVFSFCIPVHQ